MMGACTLHYHVGMKRQAGLLQYTIRGVPAEVDRVLRQKAKRNKRSLNQLFIDELSAATLACTRTADFSDLVGRWTPDPEFDEVIRSQRKIDR